ncbi:RTA1-domain-containing protein [Sparassis latifolia]|uniref:Sphingoid long-chain base transporter RSB1 n=1 Tax=Sparassis crispa TaxID=139825 RepID=A0A401GQH7_9APHY|nr:Uncharacterized protein SCP_0604570 [Sparassis crispa]GBE84478.1 Uncharacterized protein SCP_0604570 [Sparassis crispa]
MDLAVRAPIAPKRSRYGYTPTEWVCILYIVLFSITTLLHFAQALRYRLWWLIVTAVVCGILEILGWGGRLWSSFNDLLFSPYVMQITTTIIAPTPLVAANFVILGQIITRLGECYSRLSAKWYTAVFVSCDIIALIVQAAGGAEAAIAVSKGTSPQSGGRVMLAGIAFQLAAITCYMGLAAEFITRSLKDWPVRARSTGARTSDMDKNMKLMLLGLAASSVFIYIRSIYRTIELANGWTGVIIHTQALFNVFDGAMITLAMYTINVLHPGRLLGPGNTWMRYTSPRKEAELGDSEHSSVNKEINPSSKEDGTAQ